MAGANEEGKQQRNRKAYPLDKHTYSSVIVNRNNVYCLLTEKHVLCSVSAAACGAPSQSEVAQEFGQMAVLKCQISPSCKWCHILSTSICCLWKQTVEH